MISLLIPSKGRPQGMQTVLESAFSKAHNSQEIEIVFYLDEDDKDSILKGQGLVDTYSSTHVKYIVGPSERVLSKLWNHCYEQATGPYYHHCGDDVVFRTKDWDALVTSTFPEDKIGFVFGRDGWVDSPRLGTHGFLHENWVQTVGYFVPPYFSADYNDTWLTDLARRIDRLYFRNDLFIEHMHFRKKKSEFDETYQERRRIAKEDQNKIIFDEKKPDRIADAEKLFQFIQNAKVKNDSDL